MEKYLIDFDKLFENYVALWYSDHSGELEQAEDIQGLLPDLYEQWTLDPSEALGGITPREFFEKIEKGKLLDILKSVIDAGQKPAMLLLDRIACEFDLAEGLCDIIDEREKYSPALTLVALRLLREMGIQRKGDEELLNELSGTAEVRSIVQTV